MQFPDGSVGIAQSRVAPTTRGTSIYSFVLHAPPVALEHIEGALESQARTLRTEIAARGDTLAGTVQIGLHTTADAWEPASLRESDPPRFGFVMNPTITTRG